MKTSKFVSKISRLTEALVGGASLTQDQIRARFKLANPTATISDIREVGFPVVTSSRKSKSGKTKTFYSVAI